MEDITHFLDQLTIRIKRSNSIMALITRVPISVVPVRLLTMMPPYAFASLSYDALPDPAEAEPDRQGGRYYSFPRANFHQPRITTPHSKQFQFSVLGHMTCLRELFELRLHGGYDVRGTAGRTEDYLKPASRRDDECGRLVVECCTSSDRQRRRISIGPLP